MTNNLYKAMEEIEWDEFPEGLLGIAEDDEIDLWDKYWGYCQLCESDF